eukprot:16433218-Heterocapsa_arctica.AAC.1
MQAAPGRRTPRAVRVAEVHGSSQGPLLVEQPSEDCDTGADPGGGRDACEVGRSLTQVVGVGEKERMCQDVGDR